MKQSLSKGSDQGIFTTVDPKVISAVIWNLVMGILKFEGNRMHTGKRERIKASLHAAVNLILNGLNT